MCIPWGGIRTLTAVPLFLHPLPSLISNWVIPSLELREGQGGLMKPVSFKQEMGDMKAFVPRNPTKSYSVSIRPAFLFHGPHSKSLDVPDSRSGHDAVSHISCSLGFLQLELWWKCRCCRVSAIPILKPFSLSLFSCFNILRSKRLLGLKLFMQKPMGFWCQGSPSTCVLLTESEPGVFHPATRPTHSRCLWATDDGRGGKNPFSGKLGCRLASSVLGNFEIFLQSNVRRLLLHSRVAFLFVCFLSNSCWEASGTEFSGLIWCLALGLSSAFGPGIVGILTNSVLEHTFSDTASGLHLRTEFQLLILKRKH